MKTFHSTYITLLTLGLLGFFSRPVIAQESPLEEDYFKITNYSGGKKLAENFKALKGNDLVTVVYNFVDMLSHAKTEMEVDEEVKLIEIMIN